MSNPNPGQKLPDILHTLYNQIPEGSPEGEYYGFWNGILGFAFPLQDGFVIHPQAPAGFMAPRESVDVVTLLVTRAKATIFYIEVKAPRGLREKYNRSEADKQMRSRLAQLEYHAPSVLHGVSAFGSTMAFYRLDKETGTLSPKPAAVSTDHVLADVAPLRWWNTDILEPQGYQKFMEVAEEAKVIGGIGLNEA